ncbi:amidohydrolase family protein [Brevibacterium album]|uniref:amidohydrolase family protein n=1 Tax=Brevibacterium album TaxID=417948 RepID=UPI00040DDCEC|nr:amidohydrolase family protein [Brevibacterium album]
MSARTSGMAGEAGGTAEAGASAASVFWCERAWVDGAVREGVLLRADAAGVLTEVRAGVPAAEASAGAQHLPGLVLPGGVNAHSHAFHRLLRGRTHGDGGTFWTWREVMYRIAGRLTPENYRIAARAVFAEMLLGGWTSVGEFHYVHHAPGGAPYGTEQAAGAEDGSGGGLGDAHAMELALAAAAEDAGIRMRLLDTCYLTGSIGEPLSEEQVRFGDGDIDGYLRRHADLARVLAGGPFAGDAEGAAVAASSEGIAASSAAGLVTLGAAIHSVRAVPASDIPRFAELDGPVHVHLSEQPAENAASLAAYGRTPTGVLADAGILAANLSPVHATHLTREDIERLGAARTSIVMCPCTEADLADGIGPANELAEAGATIALGSDQHVVLDALRELQALEAGERLRSGERGRFSPEQLLEAMTAGGARSLGLPAGAFAVGRVCDLIEVDPRSPRTYGSVDEQIVLTGTSADIRTVVTAGQVRVRDGVHAQLGDIGELYREAYAALGL